MEKLKKIENKILHRCGEYKLTENCCVVSFLPGRMNPVEVAIAPVHGGVGNDLGHVQGLGAILPEHVQHLGTVNM